MAAESLFGPRTRLLCRKNRKQFPVNAYETILYYRMAAPGQQGKKGMGAFPKSLDNPKLAYSAYFVTVKFAASLKNDTIDTDKHRQRRFPLHPAHLVCN